MTNDNLDEVLGAAWRKLRSGAQDQFENAVEFGPVLAAALDAMADVIDRGPTFSLPPSVISALIRERAEDLRTGADDV